MSRIMNCLRHWNLSTGVLLDALLSCSLTIVVRIGVEVWCLTTVWMRVCECVVGGFVQECVYEIFSYCVIYNFISSEYCSKAVSLSRDVRVSHSVCVYHIYDVYR